MILCKGSSRIKEFALLGVFFFLLHEYLVASATKSYSHKIKLRLLSQGFRPCVVFLFFIYFRGMFNTVSNIGKLRELLAFQLSMSNYISSFWYAFIHQYIPFKLVRSTVLGHRIVKFVVFVVLVNGSPFLSASLNIFVEIRAKEDKLCVQLAPIINPCR